MSQATPPRVRRAGGGDIPVVAGSLARAFDDDPVLGWVFPDAASRPRRMERFFALAAAATVEHGEVWMTDDGAGAALWEPPGRRRPPVSTVLRMGAIVGTRTPLAVRGLRGVEAHHPRWPHWYLSTLGTDPPMQGHGRGSAVMEPVLRRCDEQRLGAYLESSKEANVPYYRHHGFEVVEEVSLPRGPRLWLMWRHPGG